MVYASACEMGGAEGRGGTRMLELKERGRLVVKWILIARQRGRIRE